MSLLFSRYLYFPLSDWIRRAPVERWLAEYRKSERLPEAALRARTGENLAAALAHARRHVPFYADRLGGSGEITAQRAFAVLQDLPLLSKAEIFAQRDRLRAQGRLGRVYRGHTSGSGGEALEFFFTGDFLARTEAAQWRGRGWWGLERGDPLVTLWGRSIADPKTNRVTRRRERLRNWLRVSAFELSHRELLEHERQIAAFDPVAIYGYSSAIYRLALFYSEHRLPPPPRLKAVVFTADALLGFQRRLVEETLRAPAVCEYGSSEAGAFAFSCREGGVHIASENVHVEILRGGQPVPDGEEGEVVVTTLHNRAMPLLRYSLGDWARRVPGRCACGRWMPRIELTNTKVVDLVRTSAGAVASGQFFDYILIELIDQGKRGIRQFLVVQKELDRFEVQVVPGVGLDQGSLDLFERLMRERLGAQIQVTFEVVAEIPREPAGKIRCFRSELVESALVAR